MNQSLTALPALPAHLQNLVNNTALMSMNQNASAGISSGGWPRISIKGGRWRLQSPSQDEIVVPEHYLDVIVVDANPHGVSKVYYDTKWDPNGEGEAPACYSDNGVGPSDKSAKPQSASCATCPHNVWGSKISEASGKQIKACSDIKKLAVMLANNPDGPIYELRIPGDSLKGFVAYIGSLSKHNIPACTVITRLQFDTNVSHQRIMFAPAWRDGQMPYIDADQAAVLEQVLGTDEVDLCTGKNDRPVNPANVKALPVEVGHLAVVGATPPPNPAFPHRGAPPQPLAPQQPQARELPPIVQQPAVQAEPVKRTRARKAPEPAAVTASPPPAVQGQLPNMVASPPPAMQNGVNTSAPLVPQGVTSASLDDLIKQAMAS